MLERSRRLDIFEGVLIGIYGNWLISFVDKISFANLYQSLAVVFSFGFFLLHFGLRIMKSDMLKHMKSLGLLLIGGHILGLGLAMNFEETVKTNQFFGFFIIGMVFAFLIFIYEAQLFEW